MGKKRVAIIGVTGSVGQEFVQSLNNHPWFEVTQIAASSRSAVKKYLSCINEGKQLLVKGDLEKAGQKISSCVYFNDQIKKLIGVNLNQEIEYLLGNISMFKCEKEFKLRNYDEAFKHCMNVQKFSENNNALNIINKIEMS